MISTRHPINSLLDAPLSTPQKFSLMLSNQKVYALFALSLVAGISEAVKTAVNYTDPSTSYKVQEDGFFGIGRPLLAHDTNTQSGPHLFLFLGSPAQFVQHKSTLFSRLNDEEHLVYLKEAFTNKTYGQTAGFATHITEEDARAISSKNQSLGTCHELAFLLMASPPKSLRALSAECIADVTKVAASVYGSTGTLETKNELVDDFVLHSYKLDGRFWEKNFDSLTKLAKNHPRKGNDAAKERTNYAKYGAHFELFVKDDDRCGTLNANEVLNTISTSQATKITRSSCFPNMKDFQKFVPADVKKVAQLPRNFFADVEELLDSSVYEHMTSEQVQNFGTKSRDERCTFLRINKLKHSRLGHIDNRCWISYLNNFRDYSQANHVPKLGSRIKLIRPECWEGVQTEGFSRIHQDDLQHISSSIMNKFLTANPDFCESLEKLETADKFSIIVPECFIRLTAEQQLKAMEKRGSSFPTSILVKFTRASVDKFGGNMSFLNSVKFTPEQIKSIGRDSQKPEDHPCSALSKDELIGIESLMKNMSDHCFAALTCLEELEPSDLSRVPKTLLALLPYDKLMLMVAENKEYFANLDAAGMKQLTSKDFCAKVTPQIFDQIKAPALAAVDARCAAALTFKKSLTGAQIRAFPQDAFRLYTKDMAAELPAIITLTPEQFHQLSADVKDPKNSAAQLLTKEALTSLPIEYVAKLSEELLSATPAASFAAFTKNAVAALPAASLRRVSAEQIKMVPAEAVSVLTVTQVQELGVALTEASTSPITHLLNDKNVKLSAEAQVAATKRAEEDKERFAKTVAASKKVTIICFHRQCQRLWTLISCSCFGPLILRIHLMSI